ncbi:MAG: D-alanyl-D-alanine carboxypeptidase [Firmicutes bacterium]|nr:D-alanyl-D-alanine carboxypeptidase [Bacillota bacterium]
MRRRVMALAAGVWVWAGGLLAGWTPPVRAAEAAPAVTAPSAILVDATTGEVLYARNPDQERPMASVTKLMTLYLAVRAVEQGKVKLSEWVPADEEAYRVGGSQVWLEPGEFLSYDQMLKAVAVGSANDAAYALAKFLSGSVEAFVARMNQEAARLGMRHTHFANPHGLPQAEHYTTARDLAILARAAVRSPLLLHYTAMREDRSIRNGKGGHLWLVNHNRLLRVYPGADGLKTGYTTEAGYCLAATARRGDTRLIAVLLGDPTPKARVEDAVRLLNWGYGHFRTLLVAPAGRVLGEVPVRHGRAGRVAAVAARPLALTVPLTAGGRPAPVVRLAERVTAPVQAGQILGEVRVTLDGRTATVPLVAARAVASTSPARLTWDYFWRIIGG